MNSVQSYRKLTKSELMSELVDIVDELCDTIEEEGFVKSSKGNNPERYTVSAKRDILTEHKYLLTRLLDYGD
jgi:hypothetical protein